MTDDRIAMVDERGWYNFLAWIRRLHDRPRLVEGVKAKWVLSIPRTRWWRSYGLLLVKGPPSLPQAKREARRPDNLDPEPLWPGHTWIPEDRQEAVEMFEDMKQTLENIAEDHDDNPAEKAASFLNRRSIPWG